MTRKLILACILLVLCSCGEKKVSSAESSSSGAGADYACRTVNMYDYTKPIPKSRPADTAYISDSIFAGDVRISAFADYERFILAKAQFLYEEDLDMYRIDEAEGDEQTFYDRLISSEKKNYYLMMGLQEMTSSSRNYIEQYEWIISEIRKAHPEAVIVIMSQYEPRSLSGMTPEKIRETVRRSNQQLQELAEKTETYYLDLSAGLVDEKGVIKEEYLGGDMTLSEAGTAAAADYLLGHIVRKEDYVKEICE